jgi:ABC-type uncharacterized transport system substrate-binding protein
MKRLLAFGFALAVAVAAGAQDVAIYQQPGGSIFDGVSAALKTACSADGLGTPLGPVMVSQNQAQDVEDLKGLEAKGVKYLLAVGTSASTLAAQRPTSSGIYIFVPNPAPSGLSQRPKWAGVSPYPDPRAVLTYVRSSMNLGRLAVVYTKKNNQEVAKVFEEAASAEKIPLKLVGLNGPDELGSVLGPGIKDADAVLLLIDPLAFSPDSLRFIVSTCTQGKKPVIGFIDSVTAQGAPFALYPQAEDIARTAATALKLLKTKGDERKIYYSSRFVMSVNEASAKALGVPYDASKVVNKY